MRTKVGMSGRQLRLTLGCGAKTAWHLRRRFMMDPTGNIGPLRGHVKSKRAFNSAAP